MNHNLSESEDIMPTEETTDKQVKAEQRAQRRKQYNKEYAQTHPEVFAKNSFTYYERNKNNPEFMQKKRDWAKARYYRMKAEREAFLNILAIQGDQNNEISTTKTKTGRPRKYNYDN
jgi:hypothetical protein